LLALPQRAATLFTTAGVLNDRLPDKHVVRLVQYLALAVISAAASTST
jgi:hypothetical protein